MQPNTKPTSNNGVFSWQAPEFPEHRHSAGWYGLLGLFSIILAGLVYLISKDIFGIVIIGLLGAIVGIAASHKPRLASYELSDSSLKIGAKAYPLSIFKSFSVADEGELVSATLIPLKRFMPPLAVYITPAESDAVLDALAARLPHDDKPPDAVDRLARRLRF